MMRFSALTSIFLACALLYACAGDSRGNRARGNGAAGTTASSSGAAATSGFGGPNPGGFSGGSGSVAGGAGTSVLPPTSTDFKRDDTAMSGLDPATIDALKAGGGACSTQLLYPYDETIFPAGIISPLVQWDGASDGAYVHLAYDGYEHVEYEFAVGSTSPGALRMPQDAWDEIAQRSQSAALRVKLSVISGGTVNTCEHIWHVAPGVMKGAIYYNTYSAPNAANAGQGAIMRINIGEPEAEVYLQFEGIATQGTGPCVSCHSVSANGGYMSAATHKYSLFTVPGFPGAGATFDVSSYPITTDPQPAPIAALPNAEFAAVYPDGSRVLAMGNPQCTGGSDTFPRAPNNFPLVEGPDYAKVLDTATGAEIPAQGLNRDWYMWMPQFSPDGTKVVFNHAKPDGSGGTDRRELAVMDYDYTSNTFSNLKVIASRLGPEPSMPYAPAPAGAAATSQGIGGCVAPLGQSPTAELAAGVCDGPCYPANPFFTPDSKAVVFWLLDQPDFTNAFPGRDTSSRGELWYADVATGETTALENAMRTLKPEERQMNYFTTMLPVQVGGYYWMFWTSRREFGNQYVASGGGAPANSFFPGAGGGAAAEASKKRIWVAAIKARGTVDGEVQATPGPLTDPSAPGFYLEGQSASGNVRAFAALAPCVQTGTSCTSGLDCCSGYCTISEGQSAGTCTDEIPMCARTNERCTTSEDCCPPSTPQEHTNSCIGGFCGYVLVE
jgi:hypothetical protein